MGTERRLAPPGSAPGSSSARRRPGKPVEHDLEGGQHLAPGQVGPRAELGAEPEREHVGLGTVESEVVGALEALGLTVGGGDASEDHRPGGQLDPADHPTVKRHPWEQRHRWLPAKDLPHRGRPQIRVRRHPCEHVGAVQQRPQEVAEGVRGGGRPDGEEQAHMALHLFVGEAHAVVLPGDELRDDVVARVAPTGCHHRRDQLGELGGGDIGSVGVGRLGQECMGPAPLTVLVAVGQTELAADGPEREAVGELGDEVAATPWHQPVEQVVGEGRQLPVDEASGGSGAEGRGDQLPVGVMVGAVHADEGAPHRALDLVAVDLTAGNSS